MSSSVKLEVIALLRKSQLLNAQQLTLAETLARREDGPAAGQSPGGLLAELVKRGILTAWQRNQLLRGQTGFVLERYRLLQPVGKGGMGHVFQAKDDRSGQIVAVKVMARRLTSNQTLVSRFRREIKASLQLNHRHIVRTLDAGRVGDVDFMVMEYVNGDQLDLITRRIPQMPPSLACEIIRQAASGLQHAFEQRMVHRDVKPANLIVDWDADGIGTIKVMDMGLVRLSSEGNEEKTVTRAGQVMGTPDYMSPEQAWDTTKADIRSDVYSLGCTFFRLLTGRIPFPGDNPLQVLMARCSKDAPSVRSLRPEIPQSICDIVARMTLRDPDARYATPADVVQALQPYCEPLTVTAFRQAALAFAAEEADLVELEVIDDAEPAFSQDDGYQQFLRQMGSGAAVKLMNSSAVTPSGGVDAMAHASAATIPILDHGPPASTARMIDRRSRQQTGPVIAYIVGSVVMLMLLGVVWHMYASPDDGHANLRDRISAEMNAAAIGADSSTPDSADDDKEKRDDLPQPSLQNPPPQTVKASPPPQTVKAGEPVELLPTAKFLAAAPAATLPTLPPLRVATGSRLEASLAAVSQNSPETAVEYHIGRGLLPGMELDKDSGQLTWTPDVTQTGRHGIAVELRDASNGQVLASARYEVRVIPAAFAIQLPDFPEQAAVAGQPFELRLLDSPQLRRLRGIRIQPDANSPAGVSIDMTSATLKWDVPANATGRLTIRLVAELLLPDAEFTNDSKSETTIVVNVNPSGAGTTGSVVPDPDEVAAAETELRGIYRRELSAARTPAARYELGHMLVSRCVLQASGVTDFAMLNLAAEQAERARAADLILEVRNLRQRRYELSELDEIDVLLKGLSRSSLSPLQKEVVTEHCLRMAASAAQQRNWKSVNGLLTFIEPSLRNESGVVRQLHDDVVATADLTKQLMQQDESQQPPSDTDSVRMEQVRQVLGRWQFQPLFQNLDQLAYIQSSNSSTPLAGNGRSLWTRTETGLIFATSSQEGVAGLLDPSRDLSRYVVRFQISQSTNAMQFMFGAGRQQELTAFLLTLDASAAGQLQRVTGGAMIAQPSATVPNGGLALRKAEIIVDGTSVSARIEGVPVTATQIADLQPGRIGLMVPLQRADGGPRLELYDVRILTLPDAR